jgi:hypothetical protein
MNCAAKQLLKCSRSSLQRSFTLTIVKELNVSVEHTINIRERFERPNHKQIVIIGGGQSGSTLINRLVTNGGFTPRFTSVIDKQSICYLKEGLDMLAHDMIEDIDIKKPILGRINNKVNMVFEEVIHFDPKNSHLGTFDGSDLTFDYCILAPGQIPDYSSVERLDEALNNKFSNIFSANTFEQAIKMRDIVKGKFIPKDIIVYRGGETPHNFDRIVSHALIFKNRFPKSNVRLILESSDVTGLAPPVEDAVRRLLERHRIVLETQKSLERVDSENKATLRDLNSYENSSEHFDILFADPKRRDHKFLTEAGIHSKDFSKETFQHNNYANLFAQGSYLFPSNSLKGMLEQTQPCTVNVVLQMLCDQDTKPFELNQVALYKGYQKYKLFPAVNSLQYLELNKVGEPDWKLHGSSWLKFLYNSLIRYKYFFKYTAKGKNFGRLGYHMPMLGSKKTILRPYARRVSFKDTVN